MKGMDGGINMINKVRHLFLFYGGPPVNKQAVSYHCGAIHRAGRPVTCETMPLNWKPVCNFGFI